MAKRRGALAGEVVDQVAGVVKFADMAKLDQWFNSAAYQANIGLGDKATDKTMVKYAIPTS